MLMWLMNIDFAGGSGEEPEGPKKVRRYIQNVNRMGLR